MEKKEPEPGFCDQARPPVMVLEHQPSHEICDPQPALPAKCAGDSDLVGVPN